VNENSVIRIYNSCHDVLREVSVLGLITHKIVVVNEITITNSYTYDNLGWLTSELLLPNPSNSPTPILYTYDLAGNRLSAGGSTLTYTHNKLNGVYHDAA